MKDYELPLSPEPLEIDGRSLTIEQVVAVARNRQRVRLAQSALVRVARCRALVDVLLEVNEKVYGLTTGFGILRDVAIAPEDTRRLQDNLIRSHSAGMGPPFPEDVVRAAILLRANTLCRGHSGVRVETLHRLVAMLNEDVFPYVPSKGSVGASGDLAPLSHLILVLMGDPHGRYYPRRLRRSPAEVVIDFAERDFAPMPSREDREALATVRREESWTSFDPIQLEAKEGLALNNGTQFMTAIMALASWDTFLVLGHAEVAAAMSLEANRGVRHAYRPEIHDARPQAFQQECARRVIGYCAESQILDFYLNTGHLQRARWALAEAVKHLSQLELDVDRAGGEPVAAVHDAVDAIIGLSRSVAQLIPCGDDDRADPKWVDMFVRDSPSRQIERLDQLLTPVRSAALSLLRTLQDRTFPRSAARSRAESAVATALDQLKRAVPDSPLVQDDYSFRCYPQVLGGAYRALNHVAEIVQVEINSATDNPLLFPFEPDGGFDAFGVEPDGAPELHQAAYRDWLKDKAHPDRIQRAKAAVIGGGNFHGQPIATAADYLGISIAEVANIAERRVAHLVDEALSRGLPAFLIEGSGLNSGFMIPQYSAAALVSENKVLCHPASTDSIPTCANSEDHVSMGTIAARKCASVVENVRWVVAIEMLAAYQGLRFREPLQPGVGIRRVVEELRRAGIQRYDDDRVMYPDIHAVAALLRSPQLLTSEIRTEGS